MSKTGTQTLLPSPDVDSGDYQQAKALFDSLSRGLEHKDSIASLFATIFDFSSKLVYSLAKSDVDKLPKEVRPKILDIIQTYKGLLDRTGDFAANAIAKSSHFQSTTIKLLQAREWVLKGQHRRAFDRLRSLKNVEMDLNMQELEVLKKDWRDFNIKLATVHDELQRIMKVLKWKRRIFIGLMIVSSVFLVASVAVLACATCGVGAFAAPAAVAGEAALTAPAAAVAGVIAGGIGVLVTTIGIGSAAAGIQLYNEMEEKASGVYMTLDEMLAKKSVENLRNQLKDLGESLVIVGPKSDSLNEDLNFSKGGVRERQEEVDERTVEKVIGNLKDLDEGLLRGHLKASEKCEAEAQKVLQSVREARAGYLERLVVAERKLTAVEPPATQCVLF